MLLLMTSLINYLFWNFTSKAEQKFFFLLFALFNREKSVGFSVQPMWYKADISPVSHLIYFEVQLIVK